MYNNHTSELRFAGHETFTLKQLWLRKAVRFAQSALCEGGEPNFRDEGTIMQLGLGKNMVSSLRFWSVACGILDPSSKLAPTHEAELIFGENDDQGLDPYMQSLTTSWFAHWKLCSDRSRLTTFWYLFNCVNNNLISREKLAEEVTEYAMSHGHKPSLNSIKRDVEVLFRSYLPQVSNKYPGGETEDSAETLFGDLGLFHYSSQGVVELFRDVRSNLPTPLFFYTILDMWKNDERLSMMNTLDWYQIAYAESSPGRVFKLSEAGLNDRLEQASELTRGLLVWTDQLGVKTLVRRTSDVKTLAALKESLFKASF